MNAVGVGKTLHERGPSTPLVEGFGEVFVAS
jgi:hypothetical protein